MVRVAVCAKTICESDVARNHTRAILEAHDVRFMDRGARRDDDSLVAFARGADGILVGHELVTPALLDRLPGLRAVSKYGVGLDNIDEAACASRGVRVLWRPGVNADAVAELTLCFMIDLCRRVARSDRQTRAGEWHRDGGREFRGRTVAVIGCGHVGSRVARLCVGFGAKPLLVDIVDKRSLADALGAPMVTHQEAWAAADLVTLHVPLTSGTRNMLDERVFAAMRPGAYLVNTARGGVVDHHAMKAALRSGRLAGAALDVFPVEPLDDKELMSMPGVILTPHVGANAHETVLAMAGAAAEELAAMFR